MNKKLKAVFHDDPETLKLLEEQEQTELLKALVVDKIKSDKEPVKVEYFIRGDKGDTPVKGVDYFTPDEIEELVNTVTPVKGEDYFDGKDGADGKNADPTAVAEIVLAQLPELTSGKDGKDGSPDTPEQIAEKLNTTKESVEASVIKGFLKFEDIVAQIKKGKYLEPRDIKGMRLDMNDQRWHGGGSSFTSPLTTKGDLYTFTTVDARIGVGSNGQLLSADSTQATGLKWITASGTGTVTSVTSADGNATVANQTTTPVITIVSAPILQTARTINGVAFDGSANITVTAAAGTLTGTTLNSTVVTSSLTSVGTITTGVWSGTIITLAKGGTGANLSGIAKGGLISGTGAGSVGITTVGTDGQVLSADSASAGGVKWIDASGTGTVTSVASADGSITVTNPTTTPDLAVVKAPILSTARTIGGVSFNGSINITVASATGGFAVSGGNFTSTGSGQFGAASGTNGQITLTGSTSGTGIIKVNVAAGAGIVFQIPSSNGSSGNFLQTDGAGVTSWQAGNAGTVTSVSVVTANGVSGSVATATTTPAITLTLGAITPSSVSTGSLTSSALTAGRVTFAGTAGLLTDDADMTFATDTLTVTKIIGSTSITDSGLTAGRVTFAGTGGLLSDDADMTFATDTLTVTKFGATTLTGTISGGAQAVNNIVLDASGNTSLKIPSAAGGTTINAAGQVCIDSTSKTLNFYDGAAEQVLNPIKAVTMTIENPTSSEDLVMFYTNSTVTVVRMVTVLVGSATPSVTFKPAFGTDRSAAGTNLITSPSATTNTTTGTTVTSFDNATVGSGAFFRCKTTAQSGTVTQGSITVFYEQAP